MSELPIIRVHLNHENTVIAPEAVVYNLVVEVQLKDLWKALIQTATNYIKVYAYVQIPTLRAGKSYIESLMVSAEFKVNQITNQTVILDAYFGGVYDTNKTIQAQAKIWQYEVCTHEEEEL